MFALLLPALAQIFGPALSRALVDLVAYVEGHTDQADFVNECLKIGQGIIVSHPDWDNALRVRYALDAVSQYAQDQGRVADKVVLEAVAALINLHPVAP